MSKFNKTAIIISIAILVVMASMVTFAAMASGASQDVIYVPSVSEPVLEPSDVHLEPCARKDDKNFGGKKEPIAMTDTEAPAAPANICVIPGRGWPTIVWDGDTRADWYNIWIGGKDGVAFFEWVPRKPAEKGDNSGDKDVTFYTSWKAANPTKSVVECGGLTCTFKPFAFPASGVYTVWMQAWGAPPGESKGDFSKGGAGASLTPNPAPGWNKSTKDFSYSATKAKGLTETGRSLTPTVPNGEYTLKFEPLSQQSWYNIWIGTESNGVFTANKFFWVSVEQLGCEFDLTCVLDKDTMVYPVSKLANFTIEKLNLKLSDGEYRTYVQSWGPAGFGVPGKFTGAAAPWQELPKLTVKN